MTTKTFILILFLSAIYYSTSGQSTKNHHKIYIPLWIGSGYGFEWSVSDEITINSGFDYRAYIGDDDFALDNFVFSPRISIEPRYYYNLKERANRGKNINSNSANYFSIESSFELGYGYSGIRDFPQQTFRILPTWGLRRELGDHFTTDFGLFIGYKFKKHGDRDWNKKPWTSGKPAFGLNVVLSHIF